MLPNPCIKPRAGLIVGKPKLLVSIPNIPVLGWFLLSLNCWAVKPPAVAGWFLSIIACMMWVWFGWRDKDYPRALMELMYLILSMRAMYNWLIWHN